MSYQGVLADDTGVPLPDEPVTIVFTIYDDPSGGTALWTETQNTTTDHSGIVNVVVGSVVPLDLPFDQAYWLEVEVDGATLDPRVELTGSPYALQAAHVEGDVVSSVDGVSNDEGDIDLVAGSNITITPDDVANTITIDAAVGGIGGGGTTDYVPRFTSPSTLGDSSILQVSGGGISIGPPSFGTTLALDGGSGHALTLESSGTQYDSTIEAYNSDGTCATFHSRIAPSGYSSPSAIRAKGGPGASGGFFTSYGDEAALIGQSQGAGHAIHGWAYGTGYAGYFSGDVRVTGAVEIPTGAAAGRVLTSDASGVGSWQAPGTGDDGDWAFDGDDIYRMTGNVGIGTTPDTLMRIHIVGDSRWDDGRILVSDGDIYVETGRYRAADFRSDSFHPETDVVRARYTGTSAIQATAVYGVSDPADGYGIGGEFVGGYRGVSAVVTPSGSSTYYGVHSEISGGSGHNYALYGSAVGTGTNYAVYGSAWGAGTNYAGYFAGDVAVPGGDLYVDSVTSTRGGEFRCENVSGSTHVVHAELDGTGTADATALYARSDPADYYGFGGYFRGGYSGVWAEVHPTGSETYFGVHGSVDGGSGNNCAVYGYATGSGTKYGVYGVADGAGTNYAGYFSGYLHATSSSAGVKSFKIDHPLDPENRYLSHSSVESPDMKNVYDGVVSLDGAGEAWVELPDWFEALNVDFRYQLTAIGAAAPELHIAKEIEGNCFMIAGGKPGMKISWQVTGIRHDPMAEAYRIQVEEEKPAREAGKYLNPEVYGRPDTEGIHYVEKKPIAAD
jgi:hypothetical protein